MKDWSVRCNSCGAKFSQLADYSGHMQQCPLKCARCKQWFSVMGDYLAHAGSRCKSVSNMED